MDEEVVQLELLVDVEVIGRIEQEKKREQKYRKDGQDTVIVSAFIAATIISDIVTIRESKEGNVFFITLLECLKTVYVIFVNHSYNSSGRRPINLRIQVSSTKKNLI